MTSVVGTPQIFRDILADFANRRGWQTLVGVQPQPDDRAVHLIPAAADDSLVSVVFRNGDQLIPRCLSRTMPAADYHSIRLEGRRGRLRLPYQTRRSVESPLHFRDGECLHADTGPWGPPPPTPAVPPSACERPYAPAWLLWFLVGPRILPAVYLSIAVVPAMVLDPTGGVAPDMVRVGLYPWRQHAENAFVSAVTDRQPVRCLLHCPWTGPQGVFQGGQDLTVAQMHHRFDGALLADASLMPVWPSPNFYRLTLVPNMMAPRLVCVLVHYDQAVRAVVLPRRIEYKDLVSSLRFILDAEINQVRLPPAGHAKRIGQPEGHIALRGGDLLDALARRPTHRVAVRAASFMKDCVLWTRNFDIAATIAVRLWFPHMQGPLITWVETGSYWDACDLTFSGSFRERYPGHWVPVPWSPGAHPHLVQVPEVAHRTAVLHDSSDGVAGLQVVPHIALPELAELLHTLPSQLHILGYSQGHAREVLTLRDGDIVRDSLHYTDAQATWPLLLDEVSWACSLIGFGLAAPRRTGLLLAAWWAIQRVAAAGASSRAPTGRDRSRSPVADRQGQDSPRAGRWRPDLACPMDEVFPHPVSFPRAAFRGLHSSWGPL